VSHRSAAALYGLDGFDQQHIVDVSLPISRCPRKQKGVRIHRCADYELITAERRQNIPVTDPARLVLDLYASEANPEVARRGLFSVRKKNFAPELQHWVVTPGGRYRIDVAFPDFRVGIEGKSRAHHLTDEAFEADPIRDANLAIAGWIIIHVTWAQLQDDRDGVVRRIRRALESRGVLACA
jgi:very-short-patch-repair endonuclease